MCNYFYTNKAVFILMKNKILATLSNEYLAKY